MKLILISFFLSFVADATTVPLKSIKWKRISHHDNIEVFTPTTYKHESGIVPIRFKATMDYDIKKVVSVLSDNSRKKEWIPNTKMVKEIEKKSIENLTMYIRYNVPWPFHDRDFLVKNLAKYDPISKTVSVNIHSTNHKDDPADGSTVRGIAHDGYATIKVIGENKTSIEMAFLNELGGLLPNFLINAATKKWPYEFMRSLKKQLKKPDIAISTEIQHYQ